MACFLPISMVGLSWDLFILALGVLDKNSRGVLGLLKSVRSLGGRLPPKESSVIDIDFSTSDSFPTKLLDDEAVADDMTVSWITLGVAWLLSSSLGKLPIEKLATLELFSNNVLEVDGGETLVPKVEIVPTVSCITLVFWDLIDLPKNWKSSRVKMNE